MTHSPVLPRRAVFAALIVAASGGAVAAALFAGAPPKTSPRPAKTLPVAKKSPSVAMPPPMSNKLTSVVRAFLATLSPQQRAKAALPFDTPERQNWHFVPRVRGGLPLGEMTKMQQDAVLALLREGLSASGYKTVETIRSLETVLQEIEGDTGGRFRNPSHYYVAVFGEPSERGVWGWRYEGHHISLNWTVVNGKVIASSPQFLGANPARVASGPLAGTRALAAEEDLGRALVTSLTPAQRAVAVLSPSAPSDILTGSQRQAAIQEDKGIAYRDLTPDQQRTLLALLREYAAVQPAPLAEQRLADLRRADLHKVKFAWMGALEPGQGHYYRIQGSTFLVEYDNTQNNANHVHCVWRSFRGDFGADLLAEHYKHTPHDHQ